MTSGTQHLERRLGKNRATNRRHLEAMGRPILGDKSEFWKAIGRQLGTHPSETSGRQLELEETAPHSKTNELPQGETNDLETTREPDTTSQTGRQINCHKGRQMNWRQPKSRTPLARLGDKCIATRGNK